MRFSTTNVHESLVIVKINDYYLNISTWDTIKEMYAGFFTF